uniref:Uncharacterized protein n=1 Tax=Arundo donax TaxID=35708 RepID=A0A0A9ABW2_ARUDO
MYFSFVFFSDSDIMLYYSYLYKDVT